MEKSRERAKAMQENEMKFCSIKRKVRKDCYRDEAALCVDAFCHSEEGSRVDTESKRVYKIFYPATSMFESHPARVWNETTNEDRSNEDPEKLIPWKCTHQTCNECGIDKTLQLHQCPVFMESEILIPVKVHRRNGYLPRGPGRTRMASRKLKSN
jgi:hypothetical protein